MEDTTDANRDTDVSSTTADVPEIQEISGSNGNVEMVVTIEKIETPEEDGNTTPPQSYAEGQETDATTMVSVEPSVVEKSPNSKESPHKINSTQKEAVTPRKETSSPKITVKSPITISPTKETDRIEVVTPTKTTPRKETIKIVINSPKDEKSQTLKTSPTKVSDQIVDSSCKALSPYKELEKVIDLKETSGKEFGNEAQTVEEPPIATSSQDIAISTDTTNTKELNNSCEVTAPNENQKEAVSLKPPIDICDKSNDSQLDANSDVSEKEHNKSISRELKSLIKSAKESKIISECTQLTSKTRKSRTPLELNTSVETEKITPRRNSNASMKSNHSEKSEKAVKRSMRSQNPEFVNKVKQFLNSVVGKNHDSDDDLNEAKKEFNEKSPSPKKRRIPESPLIKSDKKLRTDPYCWRCHWAIELGTNEKTRPPMQCTVCPRVYHYKCLSSNERKKIDMERSWVCPECLAILYAESSDTRSISLKHVSVSHLGELLQHALTRMIELNGVEPFMQPVDRALFPDYDKCVVHPMDLSQMQRNIVNGLYGSPEAFMSDAQWILHNSIIFNTLQSKLTLAARALVRLCRSEMGEIEACPECYAAAHNRRPTWFTDVCSKPHILLWAKLKGFPYWPAKGMSVTGSGVVDVRFFGAHDRAWVPAKDCFLYSEKDPNNVRSKKQIMDSMQEAEQYIRNISRKYGKFVYPPFKTPFEPTKINEQFKMMIPSFEGELRFQIKDKSGTASPKIKEKRRSNSKSSVVDGEASDNEEQDSPKAPESTEENKLDAVEVEKPMDVEENKDKEKKVSRKRRRSEAEDYVIINDSTKEKRSRIEKEATTPKQPEKQTDKQKKVIEVRAKGEENEPEKVEEKKKEKIKQKDENNEVPNSTNSTKEIVVSVNSPKTPKPKAKDKSDKPRRTIERSAEKTEERKEKRLSRGKSLIVNNVSADKDKTARPKVRKVTKSTDVEILISKNMINKNLNKSLEKFKPSKERLHFDDDTTLAVLAREVSKTGMPTITSVRSLSEKRPRPGLIEVSVDANSNASVLTSEESAHSKDGDKSPKTRESEPPVGRVGVRAFARMQAENAPSSDIEIKPEPIDFDTDRQMEKLEVMNSFRLQPVNPPATKLREVRINKLVVTPINRKKPEIRVKAKKTFPQAKKPEGSELNSKNSMVYIPIQPASGQAPVRPNRPVANGVQVQVSASVATPTTTSPQTPSTTATVSQTTPTSISMGAVSNMASMAQGPSVHTVPLITSVNGQWAFSLQPVMSVGGVDSSNGPSVNGIERAGTLVAVPTPVSVSSMAQLNPQRKDDTQLPRLQHKPMLNPFDTSNSRPVPAPSTVGPLTAKLNQNASKLTDFFRTLMEETLEKVNEPAAHVTSLKLQLEQLQWKHRQELDELKHNHELAMVEMRTSLERDKNRAVNEERRTMHLNMEAAVKTAKSKQWCANCCQEAQFYCCWNTSYCDYPCQRAHWTTHAALCTQAQDSNGPDNSKDIHARLQPAPERLTPNKNPSKPTRVYAKEMPKTSLIGTPISMVEDSSGNQTVKCVGTYKPNAQAPPVIINKQLHSNEEAKKVTTSGGYLIVGGGSTVSTPRRPTIQYVHTS